MALQDDLTALADFGIFNEEAIGKLASLVRTVQDFSGNAVAKRRGRAGKRAAKGSFSPSKDELAKWKETMTAKEIAEKHGVSMSTVNTRLRKLGLTTPVKKAKK